MRKGFLVVTAILFVQIAMAQNVAVKGTVSDTLSNKNLSNAVVVLLKSKDSTLYQFRRTDDKGAFVFNSVAAGKYLMMVTYPKFADYADQLEVAGTPKDLGVIALTLKSQLLDAVVIRQNVAVRMKGDTIEYKADSFHVAEGSSVKDLLRKMPGLQVDRNGQITAQGEKVNKVLVDGEEFFSDDPAVVIENLRADAIDKVQSYDKKSDQAEFTGVDDGSRSKTLNLVLKEDKKQGVMGKIVLGGGTEERYSSQAMLNYFKGKKKLSVYGIASNTGVTGLGFQDRNQFGQGMNLDDGSVEMGAGFIMITSSGDDLGDDWSSEFYGEGIPSAQKAGIHFSNKWNEDKLGFNGNFSLKNQKVDAQGNSLYKYLLPDSAYYSKENHSSNTSQIQKLLNTTYDLKLDSLSSLRFKFNAMMSENQNGSATNTETDDEDLRVVNTNHRTNASNSDNKTFLGSLLWRQKFNKKGRTVSVSASYKNADAQSTGYLYSETAYFDANAQPYRKDTTDQYKTNHGLNTNISSKLVYTEPAGSRGTLELNYTFNNLVNSSNRKSFNKTGTGKYDQPDPLLTNQYELGYTMNSAGVQYQYNGKSLTATLGSNVGVSGYSQRDATGEEIRNMQYTNLFPTARINYKLSAQKTLRFNYSGAPQSPSLEQIQPVRENTNPLFITVGNPLLKQAFRHSVSLGFNDFKMLSGRSIFLNASFNMQANSIVSSQTIENGITTQQYVNADGNYNMVLFGFYNTKIGKGNNRLGFNVGMDKSRNVNFINGIKNSNNTTGFTFGPEFNTYKEDHYDLQLVPRFSYNNTISTVSKRQTNYWTQEHTARFNYFFSKRFQVGTDIDFYFRQKTDAFSGDNNHSIWNANVQYKIFKNRNGVFKLEMFDILNQKVGFERDINSNYIYEKHYNTLGQYALLTFTWNFTKNFGTETK
jgi:hypothetical protein